ncbi:MAG: hypothetical protein ABFS86_07990 [Planctomycetota bacterium]
MAKVESVDVNVGTDTASCRACEEVFRSENRLAFLRETPATMPDVRE